MPNLFAKQYLPFKASLKNFWYGLDENSIDYSIDTIGKDEVDSVIPFKRQTINKVKILRVKN